MAASFNGCIDEVAAYSGTLSAARIKQHYAAAVGAPGHYSTEVFTDNPVGYWRLDDDSAVAMVNHVTNPSFETDTAGWSASSPGFWVGGAPNAVLSRDITQAWVGGASGKVVTTVAFTGAGYSLGVLPAGTYTFAIRYLGNAGGEHLQSFFGPNDSTATSANLTATTTWQTTTLTFTTDGIATIYAGVRKDGTAPLNVTYFIDGAQVVSGTRAGYYTGVALDSSGHGLNGTYVFPTNLVTNPSAEVDTTGWHNWFYVTNLSRSTAQAAVGIASVAFAANAGSADSGIGTPFAWTTGQNYSATIQAYVQSAGTYQMRLHDGNSVNQFPADAIQTATGPGWLTFTWTNMTLPAGNPNNGAWLVLRKTSGNFGVETLYYDAFIVVDGPTLPTYFDGDTSGCVWNDTPENSTSTYIGQQRVGALSMDNTNTVALYFREVAIDEDTQLNINTLSMGALDAMNRQPDYARNKWTSRTQADIDPFTQSDLDPDTQFDLERKPNFIFAAWLEVKLAWSNAGATLSVSNLNGVTYSWSDPVILPNLNYALFVTLRESNVRVKIYQLDSIGNIDPTIPLVYDTTLIHDESLAKRRKGRVGWWARFADGDAFVSSVRPRGFNFSQLRTHGFASDTAVAGTQLTVQQSPDRNLYAGASPGPFGGTLSLETVKSKSGSAIKVVNVANLPMQGLKTNPMYFSDIGHTQISFDLFFPSSALVGNPAGGLEVFLFGEHARLLPLAMPPATPDAWQHIVLYPDFSKTQTGLYYLMMLQSLPNVDATWYVDNIKVIQSSVAWWGKGHPNDAWNLQKNRWASLDPVINSTINGGLFDGRGTALQLRAEARQQDAYISDVKVTPKYAELGNRYWRDTEPTLQALPTSSFTFAVSGKTVTCTSTATSVGRIATCYWTFGDGVADFGNGPSHTYDVGGTYPVSLTVIDNQGQQVTSTQNVTV